VVAAPVPIINNVAPVTEAEAEYYDEEEDVKDEKLAQQEAIIE